MRGYNHMHDSTCWVRMCRCDGCMFVAECGGKFQYPEVRGLVESGARPHISRVSGWTYTEKVYRSRRHAPTPHQAAQRKRCRA